MKKILLIEDVLSRQKSFLKEANVSLERYSPKIDNKIGSGYDEIFGELKEANRDSIGELLEEYSCIAVHWSAFEPYKKEIRYKLERYCEREKKPLIAFSGDHESDHYKVTDGLQKLVLNSKTFYSKNLEMFLESYDGENPNVLMLGYGTQWETSVYLNVLEKINLFIENNLEKRDIVFSTFRTKVHLDELEQVDCDYKKPLKIEDDWVYLDDIRILQAKLMDKAKAIADV